MGPSHGPMSCRDFALIDGDVSSIRKGAIVYGTIPTPLVFSLATSSLFFNLTVTASLFVFNVRRKRMSPKSIKEQRSKHRRRGNKQYHQ